MAYPTWLPTVSYPVDSIVSYNGVPYQATIYHLSTNTEPPNVEVRTVDALFGPQRGWTVYAGFTQTPGETNGIVQGAYMTVNKRPYDNDDDWGFASVPNNETQQGPYAVGISSDQYQGTNNSPTFQCPKDDCQVYFGGGSVYSGNINESNISFINNPQLQTLPNGRTYYDNGPTEEYSNTLYVFFFHDAAWAVKRTFEFTYLQNEDEVVRTVVGQEKFYVRPPFILQQQPFPPFTGWDQPYFAPGFEVFTVNWSPGDANFPSDIKLTNVY